MINLHIAEFFESRPIFALERSFYEQNMQNSLYRAQNNASLCVNANRARVTHIRCGICVSATTEVDSGNQLLFTYYSLTMTRVLINGRNYFAYQLRQSSPFLSGTYFLCVPLLKYFSRSGSIYNARQILKMQETTLQE